MPADLTSGQPPRVPADAQETPAAGWTAYSEQVARQCDAVAHMARALADVADGQALLMRTGRAVTVQIVGERSATQMEELGDMLNDMDAVRPEEDDWLVPVFADAHKLFQGARRMTPATKPGGVELPQYVQDALRGLTKAQKRTVTAGYFGSDSMLLARALQRKHLFYLKITSPNGRCGSLELTPLGVTVQGILKARLAAQADDATRKGEAS